MAYGAETHDPGYITYTANITHSTTGIQATVSLAIMPDANGIFPTEAKRDQLFQGFLNQVAAMPNVTVNSAEKRGGYIATVTPT